MRMHRAVAQLLVIDTQERLLPHVANAAATAAMIVRMVQYAGRLDVPVTLAEHNPEGLGAIIAPVLAAAGRLASPAPRLRKMTFSCWAEPTLRERISGLAREQGRRQIVVAGLEAHVCVLQTVLDLIAADLDVYLVQDAISSRRAQDLEAATVRMRQAGAAIVTSEMVTFEWLERAGTAEFRDVLALIRDRP